MTKPTENNYQKDYAIAVFSSYGYTAISILVQLSLVPFYLRHMGRTDFGILVSLLSFVNYANIGLGWFSGGITKLIVEANNSTKPEEASRIYSVAKSVYVAYGFLALICFMIVGRYLFPALSLPSSSLQGHGSFTFFTLCGVYFLLIYEFNIERQVLIALQQQAEANIVSSLSLLGYVVFAVPAIHAGGGLVSVVLSLCIGVVLARACTNLFKRRVKNSPRWSVPTKADTAVLKQLISPMGFGYFVFGIVWMTLLSDLLVISWLGGPAMAADFAVLYKPAEITIQLLSRIPEYTATYVIQLNAVGDQEKLTAHYQRLRKLLFLLAAGACCAYACFGRLVVTLWVGPERAPQALSHYLLAGVCIFFVSICKLPVIYRYALAKFPALIAISSLELLLKLSVIFLLKDRFGHLSPMIAILSIHLCGFAVAYQLLGPQHTQNKGTVSPLLHA